MKVKEFKKVLENIQKNINWYNSLPPDYSNIDEIMFARKQLSTNYFFLTTELNRARREYLQAKARYDIILNQKKVSFKSKGRGNAEWSAKANTESELSASIEAEAYYNGIKDLMRPIQEVLSEMNQRNSILSKEKEYLRAIGDK